MLNPNPADNFIYITLNNPVISFDLEIDIFNSYGKNVKTITFRNSDGKEYIDISLLNKGIYVLRLESVNGFGISKFIKK